MMQNQQSPGLPGRSSEQVLGVPCGAEWSPSLTQALRRVHRRMPASPGTAGMTSDGPVVLSLQLERTLEALAVGQSLLL